MFIVYRAYAGETDGKLNQLRPSWFNKFKCWKSFIDEFGSQDVVVLWDGEPEGDFHAYIKASGVKILNYGKLGNKGSLEKTHQLLKESNDSIVCTFEDDFLFAPSCLEITKEAFEIGFPMFTPYECRERYINPQADHSFGHEYIFMGSQCYYRSVESTTGSCMFQKKTYDSLYEKLLEYNVNDRPFFRYALSQGVRLFSSQPGYATHVCIDKGINLMSPFVDWKAVNDSVEL